MNHVAPWIEEENVPKPIPVVGCAKCKCTWFEQIKVNQFKADHSLILGQAIPVVGVQEFALLKCVKCGELHAPNVIIQAQDATTKHWNQMLDELGK